MVKGLATAGDIADMVSYRASSSQFSTSSIFHTIPPERVGLDGGYDHYGLAHRVALAFEQQLGSQVMQTLKVSQRGSVVILVGDVPTAMSMAQLVRIALGTNGATDIELNGVSLTGLAHPTVSSCRS